MITSPARAGIATHSAVSISGAARCKVFCHENQSPNAPLNSSSQTSTGLTPANQTKTPNSSSAATMAQHRQRRCRRRRQLRIGLQAQPIEPTTPSTR